MPKRRMNAVTGEPAGPRRFSEPSGTPIFLNVLVSARLRLPACLWSPATWRRFSERFESTIILNVLVPARLRLPAYLWSAATWRRFSERFESTIFLNVLVSARLRLPAYLDSLASKNSSEKVSSILLYSPLFSSILLFGQGPFAFMKSRESGEAGVLRIAGQTCALRIVSLHLSHAAWR